MTEYTDLGAWALATLQAASDVTDLVVGGADGILGSGELSAELLQTAQQTRRESGEDKVLAVLVTDTGEKPASHRWEASCIVGICDRGHAYTNIRTLREAVIEALVGHSALLARAAVVNHTSYGGRGGHDILTEFDLDYEWVRISGPLVTEEEYYA